MPLMLASLSLGNSNGLLAAAATVAVSAAILIWSYRRGPDGPLRWVCLLLKLTGILAIAFCLLEPLWSTKRARPGANSFALLADNSQSLQMRDPGQPRSRGEKLRDWFDPALSPWLGKLEETFETKRYLFDARLRAVRDFSELTFDGRSSAIATALRSLADRSKGRPLAGVFLFTDGSATDIKSTFPDLAGLPPVYPVVTGSKDAARDLAIQQVTVTQSIFEDAPVSIQADIGASGFQGANLELALSDASGKIIESRKLDAPRDGVATPLRIQLKPEKPGLSFYRLQLSQRSLLSAAAPAKDAANSTNSSPTTEATLANNSRIIVADRGQGPYRILYVAGRPNWEYKFLARAIEADDQLQLVGLVRIAKREPKFDFRGRAGETSNPLFRGFGDQSRETAERYDQPVLTRLNTRDEIELRSGFPRTPEDLYGYHAIIIDDLEAEFFGPDQAALIQKYVSERGGGLLMLGGMESFQHGNYHRTPIGDLLPVYLDRAESLSAPPSLRLELTREGWLQSWARLRDNEPEERARWDGMPAFQVFHPVRGIKPGASVIASAADPQGKKFPALVVHRFGRGRAAALTIGDFWRWGMRNAEARADMDKAWRQTLRWLIADVPARVEITAEPIADDAHGALKLQVRVRDPKFQPLDNAAVTVEVKPILLSGEIPPGSSTNLTLRLPAEPSLSEPGLYETSYVPRLAGGYQATAFVTNSVGAEVGRAQTGWTSDPVADEFRSLVPNLALLERIASQTGGQVLSRDQLDSFVDKLPQRSAPIMEPWARPIWHTPFLFALALACFAGEWGIRRWKGAP